MICRIALVLVPLAFPAQAQEPWLLAVPAECAGLEAVVSFGLIEGGEGGDTAALSEIVRSGNGAACGAELALLGFGAGLDDPACREALDLFAAFGPPAPEADPGALVYDILTGASPEACALTVEFYAGQ